MSATDRHQHTAAPAADHLVEVASYGEPEGATAHLATGPGGHYRITTDAGAHRGPWQVRREGAPAALFTGDLTGATAHARRVAAGPGEPHARAFMNRVHADEALAGTTWASPQRCAIVHVLTPAAAVTIITEDDGTVVEGYYRHQRLDGLVVTSHLGPRDAHDALAALKG